MTAAGSSCLSPYHEVSPVAPPAKPATQSVLVEASGYCSCGTCCGWHRNLFGQAVSNAGGRRKTVGVTASGTRAKPGTIAADTRVFPFGTVLYVPGYGYGRVEDRGSAMVGNKIDLYFPSHKQAEVWGRKRLRALVWPIKPATGARTTNAGKAR